MYKVRQILLPGVCLIRAANTGRPGLLGSDQKLQPGMTVGLTVGSRGIRNIVKILRKTADYVKSLGCRPVLITAMGSHGGADRRARGNCSALWDHGRQHRGGFAMLNRLLCSRAGLYGDVYLNSCVLKCDALVVVNRVKPHTSFHGDHESGLLKMLAVGLGGPQGAASLHRCRPDLLSRAVAEGGQCVLKAAPVVLGLAILEDAYEQTAKVTAINPEDFVYAEKALLEEARSYLPRLPVDDLDILIVDEIGKNISGTGMDTNVIGRLRIQGAPEPASPRIKRIVVLDLTPETRGNAYGIGLADFTTERLVAKFDRKSVYTNALTSTFIQRAMLPMVLPDDRAVLRACQKSLGLASLHEARIIRIKNTLHLSEILVSENVFRVISKLPSIQLLRQPSLLQFSREGYLLPF